MTSLLAKKLHQVDYKPISSDPFSKADPLDEVDPLVEKPEEFIKPEVPPLDYNQLLMILLIFVIDQIFNYYWKIVN